VYHHVLAWREALERAGMQLSVWRIHRRIGMSGGLLMNALLRETGGKVSPMDGERLQQFRAEAYEKFIGQARPLPGAVDLLRYLTKTGVPQGIATSGRIESAGPALKSLEVSRHLHVYQDPRDLLAHLDEVGLRASAS
jgi:beta-phosphoglucomutase-like phosphatase (HAD superfamily)